MGTKNTFFTFIVKREMIKLRPSLRTGGDIDTAGYSKDIGIRIS